MLKLLTVVATLFLIASCAADDDAIPIQQISNLKIEPDPVIDDLTVSFDLNESATIKVIILDRWGQTEHSTEPQKPIPTGTHYFHFNVFPDVPGTYYVEVRSAQDTLQGFYDKVQ